jgi:hypothetical protein
MIARYALIDRGCPITAAAAMLGVTLRLCVPLGNCYVIRRAILKLCLH